MNTKIILFAIVLIYSKMFNCDFTKDFQLFIQRNFGNETEQNLTRADFSGLGSFGGKMTEKEEKV